jgi:enoyl-CoA hydratase
VQRHFHSVSFCLKEQVALLAMDNPPVNGLCHSIRLGLVEAFEHAIADPAVRAIVLAGAGRGFSAGGDIREFGTAAARAAPALSLQVHPVIENSPKPTIAAIHGLAMGGGLETAMVCHFRVAAVDTKVALPEIKLGLIPLSGTQRLPRAIGLEAAIDFILSARTMLAGEFARDTLFDVLVDGDAQRVVDEAVQFARGVAGRHAAGMIVRLPLIRDRIIPGDHAADTLARARIRAIDAGPVAVAAVEAIAAAVEAADFDAGMARARSIYDRLSTSDEVRKQRERFFAERGDRFI